MMDCGKRPHAKAGTYTFDPGAGHRIVLEENATAAVLADAVRLVRDGPAPQDAVHVQADYPGAPQAMTDAAKQVE